MHYLPCYEANNCNPNDSCATNPDGVCGVNTLGGGNAPQTAANNTYACAKCSCP
jgi:hypothetical protein